MTDTGGLETRSDTSVEVAQPAAGVIDEVGAKWKNENWNWTLEGGVESSRVKGQHVRSSSVYNRLP